MCRSYILFMQFKQVFAVQPPPPPAISQRWVVRTGPAINLHISPTRRLSTLLVLVPQPKRHLLIHLPCSEYPAFRLLCLSPSPTTGGLPKPTQRVIPFQ